MNGDRALGWDIRFFAIAILQQGMKKGVLAVRWTWSVELSLCYAWYWHTVRSTFREGACEMLSLLPVDLVCELAKST